MNDKPHLLHKGRRITTDATIRTDLEASLKATGHSARLDKLERALVTINKNQMSVIDAVQELVSAQRALTVRCERVMNAMARVVERAQAHLEHEP